MNLKMIAVFLSIVTIFIIVGRIAIKNRNRGADRLSVFEHPSVFKKPEIERVEKMEKTDEANTNLHEPGDNEER